MVHQNRRDTFVSRHFQANRQQDFEKSFYTRLRIVPAGDFFNFGQDVDLDGSERGGGDKSNQPKVFLKPVHAPGPLYAIRVSVMRICYSNPLGYTDPRAKWVFSPARYMYTYMYSFIYSATNINWHPFCNMPDHTTSGIIRELGAADIKNSVSLLATD